MFSYTIRAVSGDGGTRTQSSIRGQSDQELTLQGYRQMIESYQALVATQQQQLDDCRGEVNMLRGELEKLKGRG